MKRIIILMLACTMVLGAVATSSATEFKAAGTLDMAFQWLDNPDPKSANNGDYFNAIQRLRTKIDIIANESLKGVYYLEVGTIRWGDPITLGRGSGGALGADGVNVETKRLYLDFQVPDTELQLRMGIQGLALPSLANNNPVLDDDVAAIVANYSFTDQYNIVAAWARAADTENYSTNGSPTSKTKYDVFTVILGLNFEPVTLVPYIAYGAIGRNADVNSRAGGIITATADRDAWWLGLSAKSNYWENLNLAFDFVWGWSDGSDMAVGAAGNPNSRDQSGFYALLHADYKMEYFTPTLDLWYSSGDDDSVTGDGEFMPEISAGGLALTNLGTDGGFFDTTDNAFTTSGIGTFGAVLGFTDFSFIEDVTHDFKVAYMQGTSEYSSSSLVNTFPTDEDRAWEFNLDTNWQMYENLAAIVELGYLNPDYKGVDGEEAVWKAAIGFQYSY
ncbi:outer membrane homotrimeric porin [Halodesulfovibrio spirochaetisodalis]|uniref:outer membrane homotrimeric porin n=1 Tax=Halodesulfovibrio spirochaetisodalis TaxID=1560234 RepID=UPI00082F58B9|nr:outer membrane homotrimeric porin [Halodesulfovibrio spirochaetisodalis]